MGPLEDNIGGSQVKVVGEQTYEATDPTLDSQVSKLASTKADVLFSAVAIPKLAAGALSKAQQLGWNPENLLVSLVSSTDQVVKPSGLDGSTGIYSAAWGYGTAATLVKALGEMKEVSRDNLMEKVHNISGTVPLMLPGLKLKGSMTTPALQELHIQQFKDGAWTTVN